MRTIIPQIRQFVNKLFCKHSDHVHEITHDVVGVHDCCEGTVTIKFMRCRKCDRQDAKVIGRTHYKKRLLRNANGRFKNN